MVKEGIFKIEEIALIFWAMRCLDDSVVRDVNEEELQVVDVTSDDM